MVLNVKNFLYLSMFIVIINQINHYVPVRKKTVLEIQNFIPKEILLSELKLKYYLVYFS